MLLMCRRDVIGEDVLSMHKLAKGCTLLGALVDTVVKAITEAEEAVATDTTEAASREVCSFFNLHQLCISWSVVLEECATPLIIHTLIWAWNYSRFSPVDPGLSSLCLSSMVTRYTRPPGSSCNCTICMSHQAMMALKS